MQHRIPDNTFAHIRTTNGGEGVVFLPEGYRPTYSLVVQRADGSYYFIAPERLRSIEPLGLSRSQNLDAYLEYAEFRPVLDVVADALSRKDWTEDDYECYGEQLAEIGSERAMAGMRDTAMSDAYRIWNFQTAQRALHSLARVAPMHAEAARAYADTMLI